MTFLYSVVDTILSSFNSFYGEKAQEEFEKDAPYGYGLQNLSDCDFSDDDLRRNFMLKWQEASALWKALSTPSAESFALATSLCENYGTKLSPAISRVMLESGFWSASYSFPEDNPKSERNKFHLAQAEKVILGATDEDKGLLKALELQAGCSIDVYFARWRAHVEQEQVLNENLIKSKIFELCKDDYDLLKDLNGGFLLERVQEEVTRWVRCGNHSFGEKTAKSLAFVIDRQFIPTLVKEGRNADIAYLKSVKNLVVSNETGFSRTTNMDLYRFNEKYVGERYITYCNLFYTTVLSGGDIPDVDVKWEQRKSQIYSIGYEQGNNCRAVEKKGWVPATYGQNVPGNLLAQQKPVPTGITAYHHLQSKLSSALSNYLSSQAKLLSLSFAALPGPVQLVLQATYKTVDKIPDSVVRKLVGKPIDEALGIAMRSPIVVKVNMPSESKKPKDSKSGKPGKGKKAKGNKSKGGSKELPFKGFSKKQCAQMKAAYGGGFEAFRKVRSKYSVKGKVDPFKFSHKFSQGEFTGKSMSDHVQKCQIN